MVVRVLCDSKFVDTNWSQPMTRKGQDQQTKPPFMWKMTLSVSEFKLCVDLFFVQKNHHRTCILTAVQWWLWPMMLNTSYSMLACSDATVRSWTKVQTWTLANLTEVQSSKIVWTRPEIRFYNVILPELLPNKAEVRSKITEPDWTQV